MGERVALVTGASSGIGAATATALAADGYRVALAARREAELGEVAARIEAAGGRAQIVVADMASRADVAALVPAVLGRWGRLDVLVNNAGVLPTAKRAHEIDYEEFAYVHEVNFVGPWYLACRARDAMVDTGGGVIVNVTSTAAHYVTVGAAHYHSSKAALTTMTRALALDWARDRVRVVAVTPGRVDTPLVVPILAWDQAHGRRPNPMDRLGTPDEVAGLISYLVSDRAGFITGSCMTIDGGELTAVPYP